MVDEEQPEAKHDLPVEGPGRPPVHPLQSQVDIEVQDALDDLFDSLHNKFVYVGRGKTGIKPSELKAMLNSWDLADSYEDWWYDGKEESDLAEEPWT